jgi:tripartite-type tricarboxylate transporter receptor subunit TctC
MHYIAMTLARLILAVLAAVAPFAAAQTTAYPTAPVKVIVPFTPGTGADIIARIMQPELARLLGQPIVVENRPGASGTIAEDQVAKSPADGYTVLMGADSMVIAPQLYRSVPFHPVKDFQPVSLAAKGTLMLVANSKSGIRSLADLLARAKAEPGKIAYGSPGVGTPHHLAMELVRSRANVDMLHVPYKGTSGYVHDLLGGEVNVGFLPVHVAGNLVRDGKLVALAVGSPSRHPAAPDVPTLAELGYEGMNLDMWFGYFVPAGTPPAIVSRLHDAIGEVLGSPQVKAQLARGGLEAVPSSPGELHDIARNGYERWGAVIRKNNIAAE